MRDRGQTAGGLMRKLLAASARGAARSRRHQEAQRPGGRPGPSAARCSQHGRHRGGARRIGGYFGGRLAHSGQDVTFIARGRGRASVRKRRAAAAARFHDGLSGKPPAGRDRVIGRPGGTALTLPGIAAGR